MMEDWLARTRLMFGESGMQGLMKASVLIVGVGGVGGAVAEMLVRSGIGHVTLVDSDCIQPSNINRQLIATHNVIGRSKAEVWASRLRSIHPQLDIHIRNEFLQEDNVDEILDERPYDYVVDAIDTVTPKVMLLTACHQRGLLVVSSMGSGGKTDPSQIRLTDISKTNYCPLAKVVRTRLAKMGIKHGIACVYSTEPIDKRCVLEVSGERYKKTTTGTVSYMPNLFGCWLASHVIREIVKQTENND